MKRCSAIVDQNGAFHEVEIFEGSPYEINLWPVAICICCWLAAVAELVTWAIAGKW